MTRARVTMREEPAWEYGGPWAFPDETLRRIEQGMRLLESDPGEERDETRAAVHSLFAGMAYYTKFLQMMDDWATPAYLRLYDCFLAAGFPVDHRYTDEVPALHGAIYRLNLPLVRRMVQAGAFLGEFTGCPHNGWNAESAWISSLHAVCRCAKGRLEWREGTWFEPMDRPALTEEEEELCLEILLCLLEAGADPNCTNNDSATPLLDLAWSVDRQWVAEHAGFLHRLAGTLIKYGADRTARHRNGFVCLSHLYLDENPELFELFLGDDPVTRAGACPPDFLLHCSYFPGPRLLRQLFSLGVRADLPYDKYGNTPLTRLLNKMAETASYLREGAYSYRLAHPGVPMTPRERDDPDYAAWLAIWLRWSRKDMEAMAASLPLLLEAGASLDVVDRDGYSLYALALRVDDARVLEVLNRHGLPMETVTHGGISALCWHVDKSRGGGACIDLLLDAGCDIAAGNENNFTPLHYAALYGAPDTVQSLLGRGANIEARTRIYGSTPLHILLSSFTDPPLLGVQTLETLLAHGADPGARDKEGYTPLHYLALCRTKVIEGDEGPEATEEDVTYRDVAPKRREAMARAAKILLEHGADVTALGNDGLSALALAPLTDNPELFDLLLGETETQRTITCPKNFLARCAGHSAYPAGEALARLIALGCDVDARDEQGRTPLMNVVSYYRTHGKMEKAGFSWTKKQHLETAEDLLKAGADPNAVDNAGNSVLAYAGPEERDVVFPLLLRYGCAQPFPDFSVYRKEPEKTGFFRRMALALFVAVWGWVRKK